MSKRDDEESLYDWYINPNLRKTCPRWIKTVREPFTAVKNVFTHMA